MSEITIVQFGTGIFLRGFVDWMTQRAIDGGHLQGGIAVVKLTPGGELADFQRRSGVGHHWICGLDDGRVIDRVEPLSCLKEWIHPYHEWERFLNLGKLQNLELIVSNATEAGIAYEPEEVPNACPQSFPAKLAALLDARFGHFDGHPPDGLSVLPCELIEDNGQKLRDIVLRHLEVWGCHRTQEWVRHRVSFFDSLVDRIVSPPSNEDRSRFKETHGEGADRLITSEPYHLLVVRPPRSDSPPLPFAHDELNIVETDDISLYRNRKVRILNGAHTALVGIGIPLGLTTVKDCMENETVASFIHDLITDEILPGLDGSLDELNAYRDTTLQRFRNPFLHHLLRNIALNSLAKVRVRIVPSLLSAAHSKRPLPARLTLAFAGVLSLYAPDAPPMTDVSDNLEAMANYWADPKGESLRRLLAREDLWTADLTEIDGLHEAVGANLEAIAHGDMDSLIGRRGMRA